jgi:putative transposase
MSPNARWQVADNEVYHIVTRGNNRMKVFHRSEDFAYYLGLVQKYKKKHPVLLFHYCLMTNHVHLLLKVLKGEELKRFMQGINQSYTHYYKRHYKYTGHLWQGRFKSFLIEKDAYLLECGRYIERNPVRAKLVKDPKEWPWSSYGHYAWGEPNSLINPQGLYLDLGNTFEERRSRYRSYVVEERPYETLLDQQFQVA